MFDIGFEEALALALGNVDRLGVETAPLSGLVARVCARDSVALIDYPTEDSSLKDGFAVVSRDVASASPANPVELKVIGETHAGDERRLTVASGASVRILSGAPIPVGADAVLAEEFASVSADRMTAMACAEPGRNILTKGSEVALGETLARTGEVFTPGRVSLLAAGGLDRAEVFRRPSVGLLATGDEVLLPGAAPAAGKLFASNIALQAAWLRWLGLECEIRASGDSMEDLARSVAAMLDRCDVLLTSGGAWKGDRDLIVKVLQSLGWKTLFHRVRLGPGKAVAMGILGGKPVFCLPGGPPSNECAFLLVALPAVLRMGGLGESPLPRVEGTLSEAVSGQKDWTQVIHCVTEERGRAVALTPLNARDRLRSMARADALVLIPEGVEHIPAGAAIQFLSLGMRGAVAGCF